jgi:hypothetical protein
MAQPAKVHLDFGKIKLLGKAEEIRRENSGSKRRS